MNPACESAWDREFLDANTTKSFRLGDYKTHREKVLLDKERARLAATQEDAAAYNEAKSLVKSTTVKMADLETQIRTLQKELYKTSNTNAHAQSIVGNLGRTRMPVRNTVTYETGAAAPVKEKAEVRAFIKPCPAPDCKGYLSTAWKCGLCNTWTCPDCHDWKGTCLTKDDPDHPHTCDAGKVATAKLIAQESQSCPKCGVSICKISGCDLMFCTACNTGFNWRTGKMHQGPVHNPHYFEWLQRSGRTIAQAQGGGGAPTGGCLEGYELDRAIARALGNQNGHDRYMIGGGRSKSKLPYANQYLLEVWRLMREEEDRQREAGDTEELFRELRVKYLTNDLTTDTWSVALQRAEKDATVHRAKSDLRQIFITGIQDIMRALLTAGFNIDEIHGQVQSLVTYCNECRGKFTERFARKMPAISITVPETQPL
jgi:predicted transcriptional regulator